jgi:hypothetical protein
MNKFRCRCLFDITCTGVTGHFKSSRVPFQDRTGQTITNEHSWNRARNQQRNWETLTQLLSLRTQLHEVTVPVRGDDGWEFEFATETPAVYGTEQDPVGVLLSDSDGVPMIVNLDNGEIMVVSLIVNGPDTNVWFEPVHINNLSG